MNLITGIRGALWHFRKFGMRGIAFFYMTKYGSDKIFSFDHKNFKYPIWLRNKSSDIPIFYQIFFNDQYAIDLDFEPKVILDCGANIGLSIIYFKNRFPQAKLIAIEPEISNYELLQKNIKNYPDVVAYHNGVWNKTAFLSMEDSGGGNWNFMAREVSEGTENAIRSLLISDIMREQKIDQIDILKIDIEGSEKELFESNYENWLPKCKVIIIELHDDQRAGSSKSFFKALSKYDFSMEFKGENIICYIK